MTESKDLQAIFNQIEAGENLDRSDMEILTSAVRSNQITLTTEDNKLQCILDRLKIQQAPIQADLDELVKAVKSGQITIASGDRAIAIGESADGAAILSGDNNANNSNNTTNNIVVLMLGSDRPNSNIDSQLLQKISLILEQLDPDIIQQTYQDTLPVDGKLSHPQITDRVGMMSNLQDFRRLPTFIQQLANNGKVPQSVRDRLSQEIDLPNPSIPTSTPVNSTANTLQSHLLITLHPESGTSKFLVNAWLIPDDMVRDESRFQPLDIDSFQKGVSCELIQLPTVLDKFLHLSLEHLKGKRYELTIEIFLPLDCLCADVGSWKIIDIFGDVPVGTMYRIIVRSYERLEPKYLVSRLNQWHINWDRVKAVWEQTPNHDDFESLAEFTGCNWKQLVNNLTHKLGLKLTCGLVTEQKKDLFISILKAATPIAIWVRCDLPDLDGCAEIDALMTARPLFGLSESVLQKRKDADAADYPDRHLGTHLAMLWEDPHRLTPDALAELIEPGK